MKDIYDEILRGDVRKLNWRAMRYFAKKRNFVAAAKCRDVVKRWNSKGPA